MPKYVELRLSDGEAHLVTVLGINQVRLGIIKALGGHEGPVSTSVLMDELGDGLQLVTLLRHLKALEDAGAVTSSAPPGARQGRAVLWQLDRDRLRDEIQELLNQVAG